MVSSLLALGALVASAVAAPLDALANCTFTDAASAIKGKNSCQTIVLKDIAVPAGTTLDMTGLKSGTHVTFQGNTTFGYTLWTGPLISFSGSNIIIDGTSDHVIDCQGQRWWDGKGGNGGKVKPKFFSAQSLKNSIIRGINVLNTPVQAFSINSVTNLSVYDVTLDNSLGDTQGGHNTDAFDVGSSNGVYISGAVVKNQDDCLAINSGTNITFTGGDCSGGHGLSIGSVGGHSSNVVDTVLISNSRISNSANGVRVKTVYRATGSVSNVQYKDIALSNIANYGIVVEQDYENGKPTGHPTDGVPITNLTLSNVTGTVASSAIDVYILCATGACSDWTWTNVSVTGGISYPNCTGIPEGSGAAC
ncbi:glycosyl hydrolase family 28 [Colletotrichum graminicola]|uniref:endo-polygalacturonase n=1 Tax=Colletotrichum graminicola (strain M1.001 / M2 / FGSC 10212) TaxID=645133 RepID=E3QKW3_COLGM|nr:glycosyl hydrolase family 28 [Colletotrichum graminicola M1.001]EFQ31501.1 glycosyl hydrolase family 28 [Colletotrichum graminicola M1.001]WDK19811.1 glycosyl hydrolase family 28 [Colletotrichum graminicola]